MANEGIKRVTVRVSFPPFLPQKERVAEKPSSRKRKRKRKRGKTVRVLGDF